MPDEDKNFGGTLVLDFRKWWRHVKTIYRPVLIFILIYLELRDTENQQYVNSNIMWVT